jgi:5-methylthioadenosine/S-adenosylhomocysteine deaminase
VQNIETLISAKWIAPVEPAGVLLEDHAIAIDAGRIVALLPTAEAQRSFSARHTLTLDDHLLIPGLVNAHTHAAMTLLRGLADDLPLMDWLQQHIWPAEAKWISEEFVQHGTEHAIAEMLLGGTTCFNDMYFFPEVTARTAIAAGMRASVGLILIEFPSAWASDAQEYLDKGLALHDELLHESLVSTAFAPHAPYTVADESLQRVRVLADELDIPVHMHLHETAHEVAEAVANKKRRPMARLNELGIISPSLMAVHMTQLEEDEITLLADSGASVVHCPESNLKLASGFCPTAKLVAAGINVALGTDGAASNNDLDMLGEMHTAALIAKAVAGDASALPAHEVLQMATLNGARALGLADVIGSLLPGKSADITAVRMNGLATTPVYHPVSTLVYAAGRHHVSDVWVAGKQLVKDGKLTTMDEQTIRDRSNQWRDKIAAADSA